MLTLIFFPPQSTVVDQELYIYVNFIHPSTFEQSLELAGFRIDNMLPFLPKMFLPHKLSASP